VCRRPSRRAERANQCRYRETGRCPAETRRADQAEKRETATAASLQCQIDELKKEVTSVREEAKTARLATAGEADKWRETAALEHKRNAELQSERDNLAERLAALKATEKGSHRL
jgi:hypothetical protein